VLEAAPDVGSAWRRHYERLRLHTVKQRSNLPGLAFGAELPRYPSRADMVAYLEAYTAPFAIAPHVNEAVRRVSAAQLDDGFVVESTRSTYYDIVATGHLREIALRAEAVAAEIARA
jgi:indole-3-pyruvate monooxygenase